MKKKLLLILMLLVLLIVLSLYYTYSIDVSMDDTTGSADLTFDVDIKNPGTRTVTVEAGKTKIFDFFLKNTSSVTASYGIAYSGTKPSTVRIAQYNSSKYPTSGLINSNATKQITIIIINNSSSNYTYTLASVAGYEYGGSLVVPNNYTLITDVYSVPNKPVLVDGLIPVKYDTTNGWVKADVNNSNNDWYDYDSKIWANAVLVSSTNRSTYMNASAGTAIPEADVLAYYVWIPRYKYKVWNINKIGQAESNYGYNAYTEGIDIKWEDGTATTGTIDCTTTPYSFASPTSSTRNETCTGANNDYYTHPAFTFGSDELRGIWVGKFELSSSTPTASYGGGSSTTLTVRVKPNTISWRSNSITNFYKVIYDMQTSGNIYGLSTDRTNTDSHMLKNIEWGAVTYLTNSKYGRCSNNSCTEVTINSNSSYYTGGNNYISNVNQSTTGNIYGVYDINGGSNEYVMGNMSSASGSYTYYVSGAGSNFSYSTATARYVDTYAYGTSNYDQTAFNRSRLGDATGEVALTTGSYIALWYSDCSFFVKSSSPWFIRGGNYSSSTDSGLFYFYYLTGNGDTDRSARCALVSLQ